MKGKMNKPFCCPMMCPMMHCMMNPVMENPWDNYINKDKCQEYPSEFKPNYQPVYPPQYQASQMGKYDCGCHQKFEETYPETCPVAEAPEAETIQKEMDIEVENTEIKIKTVDIGEIRD